jgi:hypothetical protein
MDKWLNRLGQIAMVVIAVAAAVTVIRPIVSRASTAPITVKAYEPGETLDLRGVHVAGPTLLIATRSTCGFCTDSMPFWRTISRVPIVWLAVGEDSATNRNYLVANSLRVSTVLTVAEAGLARITATPTVILADKGGVVRNVWVGLLRPSQQKELQDVLASLPAS